MIVKVVRSISHRDECNSELPIGMMSLGLVSLGAETHGVTPMDLLLYQNIWETRCTVGGGVGRLCFTLGSLALEFPLLKLKWWRGSLTLDIAVVPVVGGAILC